VVSVALLQNAKERYRLPPEDKMVTVFGSAEGTKLRPEFEMLVWNVLKGDRRPQWDRDFSELTRTADVILLQEGMINDHMPGALRAVPGAEWHFVTSFIYDKTNEQTGVIGGTKAKPAKVLGLRSPGREPILNTPKTSVAIWLNVEGGRPDILFVGVHGINFRDNESFQDHMIQNLKLVSSHEGPVVFAGDFNTWNAARLNWLDAETARLGLQRVSLDSDDRRIKLDHVYVRGLRWKSASLLPHIKSSDHSPIRVKFAVDQGP
jgi:endonuclease/exonuclease/phosphatase (EEP) superfamily protein YafD